MDLSPGFAFPYFIKQFRPLRNARAQICSQPFFSESETNSVVILVKNKQYNAPEVPPISSSAIWASSVKTDDGCENWNLSRFPKIPENKYLSKKFS